MMDFDEYLLEKRRMGLRGMWVGLPVSVITTVAVATAAIVKHPNFTDIDPNLIL